MYLEGLHREDDRKLVNRWLRNRARVTKPIIPARALLRQHAALSLASALNSLHRTFESSSLPDFQQMWSVWDKLSDEESIFLGDSSLTSEESLSLLHRSLSMVQDIKSTDI